MDGRLLAITDGSEGSEPVEPVRVASRNVRLDRGGAGARRRKSDDGAPRCLTAHGASRRGPEQSVPEFSSLHELHLMMLGDLGDEH